MARTNKTKPETDDDTDDKPLTREDVQMMLDEGINGAITSHMGRLKKSLTDEVSKTLTAALEPITKSLAERAAVTEEATPAAGEKAAKGGDKLPPAAQKQLDAAMAQVEELKRANAEKDRLATEERANSLRTEERSTLTSALVARGYTPAQARAAVALLHTEDKRVARNEAGQIVYKHKKGTGAAAYDEELDLEKGLDEWSKTDEGKSFAPARSVAGSGSTGARAAGAAGASTAATEKAKAKATIGELLMGGSVEVPIG